MKFCIAIIAVFIAVGLTNATVIAQEADTAAAPATTENAQGATAEEKQSSAAKQGADEFTEITMATKEGDFSRVLPLLIKFSVPVISSLLILIVAYFFGKFLSRVGSAPVKKRIDETLGQFVAKLIFYAVMIFAVLRNPGQIRHKRRQFRSGAGFCRVCDRTGVSGHLEQLLSRCTSSGIPALQEG